MSALDRMRGYPQIMSGQLRHLLSISGSPHSTVRVIPGEVPLWEDRAHNFDILSFAATGDRVGVVHAAIAPCSPTATRTTSGPASWNTRPPTPQSRAVMERRLVAASRTASP